MGYADGNDSSQGDRGVCAWGSTLGLPHEAVSHQAPAEVELGRSLFFDTRLSVDGRVSCATCHDPEQAFTDGRAVAVGAKQRVGTRNTPTVLNAALHTEQFWDGRRASLEAQVFDPLLSPSEHGLADAKEVVALVNAQPDYGPRLQAAYGTGHATQEQLASALASYVRSLAAGDSPFDRYAYGCDTHALSESAIRGLELFRGRGQCVSCHTIGAHSASFEDGRYHSAGVGLDRLSSRLSSVARRVAATRRGEIGSLIAEDRDAAALGRFIVSLDPSDIGKFRTPSLRNVAETAPYMHDGSVPTLDAAVDQELYYRGQAIGHPLVLTPAEKKDLVSFLRALTSSHVGEVASKESQSRDLE